MSDQTPTPDDDVPGTVLPEDTPSEALADQPTDTPFGDAPSDPGPEGDDEPAETGDESADIGQPEDAPEFEDGVDEAGPQADEIAGDDDFDAGDLTDADENAAAGDADADDADDDELPPADAPAPQAVLAPAADDGVRTGDRIAKVMARAGVASRRDAERMILEGRVKVNGKAIASPALDVLPSDQIVVDGTPLEAPQETRLWLYYKPVGLVTSEADEKGRQTVFDALPRDLPRVMTIGRLDLTSEGLLLLTNDGDLKRRLELPSTAWMRRYRVRVNGQPNELTFAPLRRGAEIDGEQFQPMEIEFDSQQGANAWLTVGIREGKNREIRRAMAHVGLTVNRLIRVAYGPFRLTGLEKNEVREVKRRVLRDQLGGLLTGTDEAPGTITDRALRFSRGERPRPMGRDAVGFDRGARSGGGAGGGERGFGGRGRSDDGPPRNRPWDGPGDRPAKPRGPRRDEAEGDRRPYGGARPDRPRRSDDGDRNPREGAGGGRPWHGGGERPDRPRRFDDGDRKPREGAGGGRPWQGGGERSDRPRRFDDGDRKPREGTGGARPWQGGGERSDRSAPGERKPRHGSGSPRPWQGDDAGTRPDRPKRFDTGDRKPREEGPRPWQGAGDRPRRADDGDRKPQGDRPDRPRGGFGGKPGGGKPGGFDRKPRPASGADAGGERRGPGGPRDGGPSDRPRGPKPQGERRFEGKGPNARQGGKPGGFGDRPRTGTGGASGGRAGGGGGFGSRGPSTGGRPQGGPKGPRPPRSQN